MLNVEQYISGGIVESYVLGIADEQEKREMEKLLLLHPELCTAVGVFEADLERHTLENAVHPPEKVWNALQRRIQKERFYTNGRHNGNGHAHSETFIPIVSGSADHIRIHKSWRPAFIVILILFKIFFFLATYYYFKYKEAAKERDKLQQHTIQVK